MIVQKTKRAFTLVELIVVITILAILGTIAFMSLQGYSEQSRDSVRLSDMKNIDLGLEIFQVESGKYPVPDDYVIMSASGTELIWQGFAGEKLLNIINVHGGGKDPVDDTYYLYSITPRKNAYQALGFLENGDNIAGFTNNVAAGDLTNRYPITKGSELGILLNSTNNSPITQDVDLVNTTTEYKVIVGRDTQLIASGPDLFSGVYNNSKLHLANKTLASIDDSLVGYWDMETTYSSGGTLLVKDFSKYDNYGEIFGGINVGGSEGINGKSTSFSQDNDGVFINTVNDDVPVLNGTISAWMYPTGTGENRYLLMGTNDDHNRLYFQWHNGELRFWRGNPSVGIYQTEVELNKWYHIAMTWENGNLMRGYINGELYGSKFYSGINIPSNFWIGNQSPGSQFLGNIDDVRIYNRALSDNEVKSLFETVY